MTDTNMSLFPLAPVRFKMGWSRVVNEGTSLTMVQEGTEPQLIVPGLNTMDTFQFGVSFRFIPRTNVNYDQFYTYFKGDNTVNLASTPFTLAGGIPVDLGLPFNTPAGQPCATPILGTVVNPACNGYFSYFRSDRVRNSYPTEQFSLQSNYFRRLDVSARFSYTGSESSLPAVHETFNGLITRTRVRSFQATASALTRRISVSGDLGLTLRLTDRLRLIDNFRYSNFRIPGGWNITTANLFR